MKRFAKTVLWIVGIVVVLILLAVGMGFVLPAAHSATVARVVPGSPEEVWTVITDVDAFAQWRPGVTRAERLEPISGWPAWREEGTNGSITFQMSGVEPPRRLVTEIVGEGLPFGGTWTYELEPSGAGTLVTITEDGEIYNPVYRVVSRFVLGYEATMVDYLDGLEARMAR